MRVDVFIGVIGSGKDYRCNLAAEAGAVRVDFKDELLNMASDLVGYDVRSQYDWFKEILVGVRKPGNPLAEAFLRNEMAELVRRFPDTMTGRRLLTRLGTEVMRKRDEDYWVKQFVKKAEAALRAGSPVAVGDCRFMNEVRAIMDFTVPVRFTFCDFRSARYNPRLDHASERLARALLGLGLEDGDEIKASDFGMAEKAMAEPLEAAAK